MLRLFFGEVEVAHIALPFLGQTKPHLRDECAAQQAQVAAVGGGVFEHRVAVAKGALRGVQGEALAGVQIDGIQRFETVLQLHAIGANVLHRRGPDRAGNQGQVFQAGPALRQRPGHELVPILSSRGLHHPGFVVLGHQLFAHEFDFHDQRFDVAGDDDVAAPAQHEMWCQALGAGEKGLHIGLGAQAQQALGTGSDAKAVVGLQRDVALNNHVRIVAP